MRSAVVVSAIAIAAIANAIAYFSRSRADQDDSFIRSLAALPRLPIDDLDLTSFRLEYVLGGKPAIIETQSRLQQRWNASEALRVCGAQGNVSRVGAATMVTARDLAALAELYVPPRVWRWAFRAMIGVSYDDFSALRGNRTLATFARRMRAAESPTRPAGLVPWWLRLAGRVSSAARAAAAGVVAPARLLLERPYVYGTVIKYACPALLTAPGVGLAAAADAVADITSPSWLRRLVDNLDDNNARARRGDADFMVLDDQDLRRMFWGGTFSSSYCLHRDHADGDLFTFVLGGCKEMVVLKNSGRARDAVDDTLIQDTTAFGIDVFDHAAVPGVVGFAGVLRPGDLLFMPGDLRHAARNLCPDSFAVSQRPWRTSTILEVAEELSESELESGELWYQWYKRLSVG